MAKYMSNITKIFANLDRFDFIQFVNRRKTLTCWHQVGHSKILLLACTCGCICTIYIVELLQKVKTTKKSKLKGKMIFHLQMTMGYNIFL